MDEITALRELRPAPTATELEALRRVARERFVAGTGSSPGRPRWRLPALAGGLTAAAAAGTAAALVLTGGPGASSGQPRTAGHAQTVVTAAWTVSRAANGTVRIYLRQYANPAGLQQALQADGVNAIIRSIPSAVQTIGPAWLNSRKPGLAVRRPTCGYMPTNLAPRAVQRRAVTIIWRTGPVAYIIHPGVMPPGSALFLAFMAGMPATWKNDNTGIMAMVPVVLTNDTVPTCIPEHKSLPTTAPKAKQPFGPGGA
jgi:hypothetical protein